MTYPSTLLASGGMVQESRIPLEPTASPSRPEGGPGTAGEEGKCVTEREERKSEKGREEKMNISNQYILVYPVICKLYSCANI